MNIYAPDYYPAFRCIASKCGHTCCAGWEIDVDAERVDFIRRAFSEIADGWTDVQKRSVRYDPVSQRLRA